MGTKKEAVMLIDCLEWKERRLFVIFFVSTAPFDSDSCVLRYATALLYGKVDIR
jgi:hypothetical protein